MTYVDLHAPGREEGHEQVVEHGELADADGDLESRQQAGADEAWEGGGVGARE